LRQQRYYEQQKEYLKIQISNFENELKTYEERATELEQKIEGLNEAKYDLYDLLSRRVGYNVEVASTPHSVSDNTFGLLGTSIGGFGMNVGGPRNTLVLSSSAYSNQLGEAFSKLEYKVDTQITDFMTLTEQVNKYKPYLDALPSIWPLWGRVTSYFGYRPNPFSGRGTEFHAGIDIIASTGTPVVATGNGFVDFAGWNGGYGYTVIINHGFGIETLYAHNSRLAVSEGDFVARGAIISYAGSTGRSTGPHLHYEVRVNGIAKNPLDYLK
jgi:murein DD-endopeptidase MepM/ murein hydrolase activator NlpD